VDAQSTNDAIDGSEWKYESWNDFFGIIMNEFNTATEHWNKNCRNELNVKLSNEVLALLL
jgi:hypothetical protein